MSEKMNLIRFFSRAVLTALMSTLVVYAPAAWAQSDALIVKRSSELRNAPGNTAPIVATLPAQTPITRLPARQGPWLQVRTDAGATGWLHLFDVGSPNAPSSVSNTAAGALRGLGNFLGGGSKQPARTSTSTATIGIRGLSSEDISQAQPNIAAVTQVDAFRVNSQQARKFGADSALRVEDIAALQAPVAPTAGTSGKPGSYP
jgi:hypothetical protein